MKALIAEMQDAAADILSTALSRIVMAALIGGAAAIGFGFTIAALWSAIAGALGSEAASLILAAGFFLAAGALYLLDRRVRLRRRLAALKAAEAEARARRPHPPLAEAFVAAMKIGRALRRR